MKHLVVTSVLSKQSTVYLDGVKQDDDCVINMDNLSLFINGNRAGEVVKLENFGEKIEVWYR